MSLRLLHIIDDAKFIDYCKSTYEFGDYQNTYLPFQDVELSTLRQTYDLLFIHYLRRPYEVIFSQNLFDPDRIVWTLWGADAFSLGAFFNTHLMPQTRALRTRLAFQKSKSFGAKIWAKSLAPRLFDRQPMHRDVLKSMRQIKHLIVLVPGDCQAVKQAYQLTPTCYHINYVDPLLARQEEFAYAQGDYILMGNSAEFTNNYLDVLEQLDIKTLGHRKLFLPLSYGDPQHAAYIAAYAEKKFGKQARSLINFMPFEEYVKTLMECEIAIMPHIRQQAIGNIVKLLLQGCHIYFNEASTVYQFLKKEGFWVGTLAQISSMQTLTDAQKEHNQQLALHWFGKKRIHAAVQHMIQNVLKSVY